MTSYRLIVAPEAEDDVVTAFEWYETERAGLGRAFLAELAATYDRIRAGPLRYQVLQARTRHARLRRFPYAVYFSIVADVVVVTTVLHARRDPAIWQRRRS